MTCHLRHGRLSRRVVIGILLFSVTLALMGCAKQAPPPAEQPMPSAVAVTVNPGGPLVLKTATAEFDILRHGYIQAFLLKDGKRLTLDEPHTERVMSSPSLHVAGKGIGDFEFDLDHAKITEARGGLGPRGKRVEIIGHSASAEAAGIEVTLAVEVFDDFPNVALTSIALRNLGRKELSIGAITPQLRRLNASLIDPRSPPHGLWSFYGSGHQWGEDQVVRISKGFSRSAFAGLMSPEGTGGGIPLVAYWTTSMGLALGHVEPGPVACNLATSLDDRDGRVLAGLLLYRPNGVTLAPGQQYATPRTFVAVYSGDFYEPLRLYSTVLQRQGWRPARPTNEAYNISWCGWGYEFDVTPAQMLGTIPKLKELNIKWATLDDRWFENYGDWEPRPDTFPGDSIKKMVDEFHRQGMLAQIWWLPLGVEDGQGKYSSHKYKLSRIVAEHPDWLILDQEGKHARMVRNLAALCPALPKVLEYHKKLTEKLIRDWGFDGHKLDNIFTVPPCYNPKHGHKTAYDSVSAMSEVYRVIFETTRTLKPESVTQICPCGTSPNHAWLPYMDQAVTADPVGARQVRYRIKIYKALLGPQAAVYGDHVELTGMKRVGGEWAEVGRDFASTIGTGGVPGTKFSWPDYAGKFRKVLLTPDMEKHWKKWIDLYHTKMLSCGTFRNLYVYGYDVPEGYAIAKDGKMYYAFFAPDPAKPWKGEVELRGLEPGKYRVVDYAEEKDLGAVTAPNAKLATEFTHHLLLEVSRTP